ncbi:MAG: hypothetical protein HQL21_06050 [Candidatus Omnitrophica bacterium]|nr:hypothetical protein [Candidatus Omnitrophota bacterium]
MPILVVTSQEGMITPELGNALGVDYFNKSGSSHLIVERINKFFVHSEAVGKDKTMEGPEAAMHKKHDHDMWAREMRMIENYVREALSKEKDKFEKEDYYDS